MTRRTRTTARTTSERRALLAAPGAALGALALSPCFGSRPFPNPCPPPPNNIFISLQRARARISYLVLGQLDFVLESEPRSSSNSERDDDARWLGGDGTALLALPDAASREKERRARARAPRATTQNPAYPKHLHATLPRADP
jgi:hypothetical protein